MLSLLQRGLEQLYRLEPTPDVRAFMVDEAQRQSWGLARQPHEQLLLHQSPDGALEVGLYVDPRALANLERHDPRRSVGEHNLHDLCLAVEGVSHFVYVAVRARADVPVSGLELELQAEVDKYVTCLLLADGVPPRDLRARLFERIQLADDLSAEERERYRKANACAARYARSLEARFVEARRIPDMLSELRRFYRMRLADKLDRIAEAA
ncbi:MAG TPA: hypothetical protein VKN99_18695 [Polyangia bacterium]|nr:hypothetical protein [Polyangia bacterium]